MSSTTTLSADATITPFWHSQSCLELHVDAELSAGLFLSLDAVAQSIRTLEAIASAISSYRSIAIYFETPQCQQQELEKSVLQLTRQALRRLRQQVPRPVKAFQALYNGEDLQQAADSLDITAEELKRRHQQPEYTVAAIGFLPHFAYLWGLDQSIALPRLATPRTRVPAGAIGIAGEQTGVYPQSSPGGWQLIGQLASEDELECWKSLRVGDRVRFLDCGGN